MIAVEGDHQVAGRDGESTFIGASVAGLSVPSITIAPICAATSGVRSVELLSTTIVSSTKPGMSRNTS